MSVVTPNFHSIAEDIFQQAVELNAHPDRELTNAYKLIVEALRIVWNQRGAADIATIELQLAQQMGATASGPYLKNLDRALRALDAH
jgi:hypothetical protein